MLEIREWRPHRFLQRVFPYESHSSQQKGGSARGFEDEAKGSTTTRRQGA